MHIGTKIHNDTKKVYIINYIITSYLKTLLHFLVARDLRR